MLFENDLDELAFFIHDRGDDGGFELGGYLGSRNFLGFFGDGELYVDAIENDRTEIIELGGLVVEQAHRAGISVVADVARESGIREVDALRSAGVGGVVDQQTLATGGNLVDSERIDRRSDDVVEVVQHLRLGAADGSRRWRRLLGASRGEDGSAE